VIQTPGELDDTAVLFDGSASLVRGALIDLIREQLGEKVPVTDTGDAPKPEPEPDDDDKRRRGPEPIPSPATRHSRVRIRVGPSSIARLTSNLQPYLLKVIQEQDAGAEVDIVVEVTSGAGIAEDVITKRILEAFDQLGISVKWERD
jgi:hypothetical protein